MHDQYKYIFILALPGHVTGDEMALQSNQDTHKTAQYKVVYNYKQTVGLYTFLVAVAWNGRRFQATMAFCQNT